ncbi:helix-turn-helix domain-containing protein [Paenibacillus protaetiae]|uniref:XRE family transcriptional regulator n=1 Tax=Paenibacillus protaetiae TaxID=2509456 RepID=A0A4P6F7E6_9BACL|nr:helix-turn-helix transcriptional regulator [Paenibacillus protaetiae]QAY66348.1 XRE family transcriptional regulator [Paenibacillus protaetiae]
MLKNNCRYVVEYKELLKLANGKILFCLDEKSLSKLKSNEAVKRFRLLDLCIDSSDIIDYDAEEERLEIESAVDEIQSMDYIPEDELKKQLQEKISSNIVKELANSGKKGKDLAEHIGISEQRISKLKSGQVIISASDLPYLKEKLGVSITTALKGTDKIIKNFNDNNTNVQSSVSQVNEVKKQERLAAAVRKLKKNRKVDTITSILNHLHSLLSVSNADSINELIYTLKGIITSVDDTDVIRQILREIKSKKEENPHLSKDDLLRDIKSAFNSQKNQK